MLENGEKVSGKQSGKEMCGRNGNGMKFKEKQEIDIVRQAKLIYIICAGMMFLLGIALLLFPEQIVGDLRCYLIGGVFCLNGAARLLGYFANDLYRLAFQFDLALGALVLLVGVILFIYPSNLAGYTGHLVAISVLVDGLFKVQTALDGKKFGIHKWKIMICTAVLTCILAFAAELMMWRQMPGALAGSWAWFVPGAILIVDGAENIWHTSYTVRVRAKKKGVEDKYSDLFSK